MGCLNITGDKVKRVIFHLNMHVWLSESSKHQTEEFHNLYHRDCSSQCTLTGDTVHFGGSSAPPIVNALRYSNAVVGFVF